MKPVGFASCAIVYLSLVFTVRSTVAGRRSKRLATALLKIVGCGALRLDPCARFSAGQEQRGLNLAADPCVSVKDDLKLETGVFAGCCQ